MLETQLKVYDDRLKTRCKTKPMRADLMAYSVVALGATMTAPEIALGAIVHKNTTPQSFSTTSLLSGSASPVIDIDGAGNGDWSFRMGAASSSSFPWIVGVGTGAEVSVGNDVQALAPGFMVGNTLAAGGWNGSAGIHGPYVFGNARTASNILSRNVTNYIGIRFQGDTGAGGTQYAWLKVRVESSNSNQVKFRILEWAYDNSGAAICVGDTGSGCGGPGTGTPVSASVDDFAPLTLLGLGAVGLAAFRRRRDKALAEGKAKH